MEYTCQTILQHIDLSILIKIDLKFQDLSIGVMISYYKKFYFEFNDTKPLSIFPFMVFLYCTLHDFLMISGVLYVWPHIGVSVGVCRCLDWI